MLLPQGVDWLQLAALLDMPKGPSVTRRGTLKRGADLVDRTRLAAADDRAVGAHAGGPSPLAINQTRPGGDHAALHECAKRNSRLLALVGNRLHRAFVERQGRGDALAGDLYVGGFALNANPAPAEPPSDCAGRSGAEEGIEHHVTRLRAGEQDPIE